MCSASSGDGALGPRRGGAPPQEQEGGSLSLCSSLRRELAGLQRQLSDAADAAGDAPSRRRPSAPVPTPDPDPGPEEALRGRDETIRRLRRQLSDARSQKKAVDRELFEAKKRYVKLKRTDFVLIKRMAAKFSEQLRSRDAASRGVELEPGDFDLLVEKVEELADENGELVAKIQELEEEGRRDEEDLAAMGNAREECDVLRQSLEEAMEMATGMGDELARLARDHESTVDGYVEKVVDLKAELMQAALAQARSDLALEKLKEENELLRTQFADAERYHEENLARATRGEKQAGNSRGGRSRSRRKILADVKKSQGGPDENEGQKDEKR